jgi:hypothetical protein
MTVLYGEKNIENKEKEWLMPPNLLKVPALP